MVLLERGDVLFRVKREEKLSRGSCTEEYIRWMCLLEMSGSLL